jgi:HrpA-like RNA helicase
MWRSRESLAVDSGLAKSRVFHPWNAATRTQVDWVSQSSAEQRAGRAGRTGPGECFRLYTRAALSKFEQFFRPEMALRSL